MLTIDTLKKTIAANIRQLRRQRDVSATELADALDVSQSTVSDWETGKKMPKATTIEALAEFFGVLTADILTSWSERADRIWANTDWNVVNLDKIFESGAQLYACGRLLEPSEQQMVIRLIHAAIGSNQDVLLDEMLKTKSNET